MSKQHFMWWILKHKSDNDLINYYNRLGFPEPKGKNTMPLPTLETDVENGFDAHGKPIPGATVIESVRYFEPRPRH